VPDEIFPNSQNPKVTAGLMWAPLTFPTGESAIDARPSFVLPRVGLR